MKTGTSFRALALVLLCGCMHDPTRDAASPARPKEREPRPTVLEPARIPAPPPPAMDAARPADAPAAADASPANDGAAASTDAPPPPPADKRFDIEVVSYTIDDTGSLTEVARTSILPASDGGGLYDANGSNIPAAEIAVAPNGKLLFASIRDFSDVARTGKPRDHNLIVSLAVAPDGKLTRAGSVDTGGTAPRGFAVDPSGRWLVAANEQDGSVAVIGVGADGALTRKELVMGAVDPATIGVAIASPRPAGASLVFVDSGSQEIQSFELRPDGTFTRLQRFSFPGQCGAYLAVNVARSFLFSANDCYSGVTSFSYDATGKLTFRGGARSYRNPAERAAEPNEKGRGDLGAPVFLDVHRTGNLIVTANYGGGVYLYRVGNTGTLELAHSVYVAGEMHSAKFHPTKDVVYAQSKLDRAIHQFVLNPAAATLTPHAKPRIDTNPARARHLAISPDGKLAFLLSERSFFVDKK